MSRLDPGLAVALMMTVAAPIGSADTLRLRDGTTLEVTVRERTAESLTVEFHGGTLVVPLDQVERLEPADQAREPTGGGWAPEVSTVARPSTDDGPGSDDTSRIFQRVAPAVVVIVAQRDGVSIGQGTGFIVDPNGSIVTAYPLVAGADDVSVRLKDGRIFPAAAVVDFDHVKEICVLKIEASGLPHLPFASLDQLTIGEGLFVISHPYGYEYTMVDGLLSGIRDVGYKRELQFSAPIAPGSSGGPLLDRNGRAIGLIVSDVSEEEHVNLAVPIGEVRPLLHEKPRMTFEAFAGRIHRAAELVSEAAKAILENEVRDAIGKLEEAIEVDPESSDAFLALSLAHGKSVDDAESLSASIIYGEEALALGPDADTRVFVGLAYVKRARLGRGEARETDHRRAMEYFLDALRQNPRVPDASRGMGLVSMAQGDVQGARRYFEKELEAWPDSIGAYVALGTLEEEQERPKQAIEAYKRALRAHTSEHDSADLIHAMLGRVYVRKGDRAAAERELEQITDKQIARALKYLINERFPWW